MSFWQVIRCEGDATARGIAYGTEARELIRENIEVYRDYFHQRFKLGWNKVRVLAGRLLSVLEAHDPELRQEMQAVAIGAGVTFHDILAMNCRSSLSIKTSADGCTAIACLPPTGGNGAAIMGQNWDNVDRLQAVVLRVVQPGKPEILTFTEAGMLAKMGLNSRGIALCLNGLFARETRVRGVPIFCLMRRALEATNLTEAVRSVTGASRDAPHNYMFATSEGAVLDVEALCGDFDVLAPEGRFMVHTNHLLSPRMAAKDLGRSSPGTHLRLWRARRLLEEYDGGTFGVAEMRTILSDHFAAPDSICFHGMENTEGPASRTKCAIIMEPVRGCMHISTGNPCESPFETVELGQ